MRLARIGSEAYDVVAIADNSGWSLWDELRAADPSDGGAEQMRVNLRVHVPRNGPSKNEKRCLSLGDNIFEFKEWGVRVLWFYDAGEPVVRWRIICTHYCGKLPKKKFQQEKKKAISLREAYLAEKLAKRLPEPVEVQP
jgi:hypothetical protein